MLMVRITMNAGRMPAYRAALGFEPTVRISKPSVVLYSRNQMKTAVSRAMTMPRVSRVSARMIGSAASGVMSGVRGNVAFGSLKIVLAMRFSSR